ncbi:substrate-binding domain-containing protein [Vibrio sp. WXL103]|uniref:substrate-binding domain-containing protein n=1 Tax=unclassified Vibrio TaxID=2614977 RepID=UPI003EC4BE82
MKKAILALTILTSITASLPTMAKDVVVGFSNRTLNGAYFSAITTHISELGKEQGYKVISTDARADLNKQMADVEDLVAKGIDYLILNPQDPASSLRIVEQVRKKGIPVITVDSDISTKADVVTRILPDNEGNNLLIGEYAVEQFGNKKINLAVISGNQGNLVGRTRRTSFFLGIIDAQLRSSNKTNLEIITQAWGGWDQQGGMKAAEDILVAYPNVNAIYTENDDMALGAIRAIRAAGKTNDIRLYSYDGNKNAYKAIADGKMDATGENNPLIMAKMAIDIIKELEANEKDISSYPDYSLTPTLMVNEKNAQVVYDKDSLF